MSIFKRLKKIARSKFEDIRADRKISDGVFSASDENRFEDTSSNSSPSAKASQDPEAAKFYSNLELSYGASFAEIKASYRRLISQYHPDIHVQNEKQRLIAEEITMQLNAAYLYFKKKN